MDESLIEFVENNQSNRNVFVEIHYKIERDLIDIFSQSWSYKCKINTNRIDHNESERETPITNKILMLICHSPNLQIEAGHVLLQICNKKGK